jgi:hypothetical protein
MTRTCSGASQSGHDAHLLRRQPERKRAGEVLDQDAHEALHRAERGAVDHHGLFRRIVPADVLQVELLGQVVV